MRIESHFIAFSSLPSQNRGTMNTKNCCIICSQIVLFTHKPKLHIVVA